VQNSERRASKKETLTGRAGEPRGPCNELAWDDERRVYSWLWLRNIWNYMAWSWWRCEHPWFLFQARGMDRFRLKRDLSSSRLCWWHQALLWTWRYPRCSRAHRVRPHFRICPTSKAVRMRLDFGQINRIDVKLVGYLQIRCPADLPDCNQLKSFPGTAICSLPT
jgi:hypothetical protein